MATLRKKGNVYFIDYRLNGRRFRKSVGKSKKIAELIILFLSINKDRLHFLHPILNFIEMESYGFSYKWRLSLIQSLLQLLHIIVGLVYY